jgi:hypothetical protein
MATRGRSAPICARLSLEKLSRDLSRRLLLLSVSLFTANSPSSKLNFSKSLRSFHDKRQGCKSISSGLNKPQPVFSRKTPSQTRNERVNREQLALPNCIIETTRTKCTVFTVSRIKTAHRNDQVFLVERRSFTSCSS